MKLSFAAMASAILFVPSMAKEVNSKTLFKDDKAYWNRLLQNFPPTMSTSPPTPRPTTLPPVGPPPTEPPIDPPIGPPPTDPPTDPPVGPPPTDPPIDPPVGPPPTDPPIDPPVGPPPTDSPTPPPPPCEVEVTLECTLKDDPDTSCDVVEQPTELTCSGCPPVTLCFIYTAMPCPDAFPTALLSCTDTPTGPQPTAVLTVSSGGDEFFSGPVNQGQEICFDNGGADLPAALSVTVESDTGSAQQLSTIDATCADTGGGLTLLDDYGSLQLTHYINCNGNNDCFVPLVYSYTAKNSGEVGATMTEFSATINDDEFNLIATATDEELRLDPEECYINTTELVADCCSDASYQIDVNLVSVSDDGKVCNDTDTDEITKPTVTAPPAEPPVVPPSEPPVVPPTDAPAVPPSTPPVEPPTDAPVVPQCNLELDVACVAANGGDCSIECTQNGTECLGKPTQLGFQYIAGDCEQSFNNQDDQVFQCEDYLGGPLSPEDEVYIRIVDIRGLGIQYYEGARFPGQFISIDADADGSDILQSNVNVTIHSSPDRTPDTLLQTMVIHTSCSQPTFLNDCYGSLLLTSFNDTEQGNVTCIEDAQLQYTVTNFDVDNDATLSRMISITSIEGDGIVDGVADLTDLVAGEVLNPGEADTFVFDVQINTNANRNYTVFTTLTGEGLVGASVLCNATNFTSFAVGNPGGGVGVHPNLEN